MRNAVERSRVDPAKSREHRIDPPVVVIGPRQGTRKGPAEAGPSPMMRQRWRTAMIIDVKLLSTMDPAPRAAGGTWPQDATVLPPCKVMAQSRSDQVRLRTGRPLPEP
jgi:hypothetical protein